jgi:hypothetical protein
MLGIFFFFWYWGLNSDLHLEPLYQTPLPLSVMGFLEIGSLELFARAGLEP